MTEEQVVNAEAGAESQSAEAEKRERSTIQFPYNDLDDAVGVAKAVHANAGVQCTIDQLAAYLRQSLTSGAFRLRASTAAIFGLTENERGTVRLTDLGRRMADPAQEIEARAEAFLHVPLYGRIYANYKGFTLPPAAALERFMREVGVSPKQTDRARQAFMRSARQAGFFVHGEDRLVRPASGGPGTKPIDEPKEDSVRDAKRGGGGGSGDPPDLHPFISGLLGSLPHAKVGEPKPEWPISEQVKWLQTAASIFSLMYESHDGRVKIEQDG